MELIFYVDLVPIEGIGQEVETNSAALATVAYNSMLEQAEAGDKVVLRVSGRKIHETTVFTSFSRLEEIMAGNE